MTDPRLHIDGPASIDGLDVDQATVPLWAVEEIATDGPATIAIERDGGTETIRDRDAIAAHLRDAIDAGATPAEILDHLAIQVAGIDSQEWADLRGINRETAEQHVSLLTRQLTDD